VSQRRPHSAHAVSGSFEPRDRTLLQDLLLYAAIIAGPNSFANRVRATDDDRVILVSVFLLRQPARQGEKTNPVRIHGRFLFAPTSRDDGFVFMAGSFQLRANCRPHAVADA